MTRAMSSPGITDPSSLWCDIVTVSSSPAPGSSLIWHVSRVSLYSRVFDWFTQLDSLFNFNNLLNFWLSLLNPALNCWYWNRAFLWKIAILIICDTILSHILFSDNVLRTNYDQTLTNIYRNTLHWHCILGSWDQLDPNLLINDDLHDIVTANAYWEDFLFLSFWPLLQFCQENASL